MRTAGVTIGPLISYESAFPGLRRELARLGVDLTVRLRRRSRLAATPADRRYGCAHPCRSGLNLPPDLLWRATIRPNAALCHRHDR